MPRGVGVVCLWLLMEWFVWMWRVALSLMTVGTRPDVRAGRQFMTNTEMAMRYRGVSGRDGSEVWWHARVLCEWEVVSEYNVDSGKHADKQIFGGTTARP